MHYPCAMGRFQSRCNLMDQRQGFLGGKAAHSPNTFRESLSLQELHAHEDDCAFTLTLRSVVPEKIKYPADVGVGHSPCQLHFAFEACKSLVLPQDLRSDSLDRQVFLQGQILRFIYLAHSTGSNEAYDAKTFGENLSGGKLLFRLACRRQIIHEWHRRKEACFVFMLRQLSSGLLARDVIRVIPLKEVCTMGGIAL